jgi:hypothetical protein
VRRQSASRSSDAMRIVAKRRDGDVSGNDHSCAGECFDEGPDRLLPAPRMPGLIRPRTTSRASAHVAGASRPRRGGGPRSTPPPSRAGICGSRAVAGDRLDRLGHGRGSGRRRRSGDGCERPSDGSGPSASAAAGQQAGSPNRLPVGRSRAPPSSQLGRQWRPGQQVIGNDDRPTEPGARVRTHPGTKSTE